MQGLKRGGGGGGMPCLGVEVLSEVPANCQERRVHLLSGDG